jgi:pimeloyl-ACP methyl ester carboxylesterase
MKSALVALWAVGVTLGPGAALASAPTTASASTTASALTTAGRLGLASTALTTGTTAPSGSVDIAAAPTNVAVTSAGRVAYREVGHGPPLVLVMGFSGTMDDWAPSFVDQLGAHFRVVVLDNAGVGETAAVGPPLTITAMANQVSALITSLHLGRTAVLGWSMGGMTAQALAVLHPSQISRLVLAATQAGTGKALPIPPAAAAAAANPGAVLTVLFPPAQLAAAQAYGESLLEYSGLYRVTPAVKAEQADAVTKWMAGDDAAGRAVGSLHLPALVADGTVDALDPVGNARLLASLIHGAQLALYPGAGHAFLFQDENKFVPRLEAFLRG